MEEPEFINAKSIVSLSTGEVIRMLREFKEWTQEEFAMRSGISLRILRDLEDGRVDIGKSRAGKLAKAFDVHPAIIMCAEYSTSGMPKTHNRQKNS